jgi:outer membrane receptor protein involved in Fe transport
LRWRRATRSARRSFSIAPPFLDLLSQANQIVPPSHSGPGAYATQTINSRTLESETAFGYDVGADYAFRDNVTFASTDFYLTNLFNQFLTETYLNGTCPVSICGAKGVPLYVSKNVNLSNARYEGIELTIKRTPPAGWGFSLAGSTQRGYAYNLPPGFYCGAPGCVPGVPKTYNNNLGIIAGQNYIGEFVNNTGSTTTGVSNQAVPYLQGDARLTYRFRNGTFASSARRSTERITRSTSRRSALRICRSVTIPLINGQSAGTIGNVLGPARYLFLLTKAFSPAPLRTPHP